MQPQKEAIAQGVNYMTMFAQFRPGVHSRRSPDDALQRPVHTALSRWEDEPTNNQGMNGLSTSRALFV